MLIDSPRSQPVRPPLRKKALATSLPHLATRIFNRPLLIHPEKAEIILGVLGPRLGVLAEAIPALPLELTEKRDSGEPDEDDDRPYDLIDGVALIPISGTLVHKASGMRALSGMTSYGEIAATIAAAMSDPECKSLLLDISSPGGEVSGMFELADYIYSLRGQKPIRAISNDSMYSAAYGIGSAADQVYLTQTAGVGSIGCYMLFCDQSQYDAQKGLKYTYVYAGNRKVDGNPHQPLSDEAYAQAKKSVDRIRAMFVQLVSRNRNVPAQQIYDTQAGTFEADDACPMLADRVMSFDQCLGALREQSQAAGSAGMVAGAALNIPQTGLQNGGIETTGAALPNGDTTPLPVNSGLPPLNTPPNSSTEAAAIPPHKTPTSNASWDGPANEARLKLDQPGAYYRKAYAWVDSEKDETKKNAYRFIHHEVSGSGAIGAANVQACRTGIGVLNGARGGTTIPAKDRQGVYDHLAKHLKDAGLDAPPLKSEAEALVEAIASVYELEPEPLVAAAHLSAWVATARPGGDYGCGHYYAGSDIELHLRSFDTRAQLAPSGDSRLITCCVAPYNQLSSDLGGYKEIYQPGCFTESLTSGDCRALFNHNPDYVLGRQSAGTARFFERPDGLYFEADAPETQWSSDLLTSMRRGDINQGSSAFFILRPRWEYRSGQKVRVIEKAKLVEGSVVSFAAYESSQASAEQPASSASAAVALALISEQEKLAVSVQQEQLKARLRLLSAS